MVIVEVRVIVTLIVIVKKNLRRLATPAQDAMVPAASSGMTDRWLLMVKVTRRNVLLAAGNIGVAHSIVMRPVGFVMEEGIKSIKN